MTLVTVITVLCGGTAEGQSVPGKDLIGLATTGPVQKDLGLDREAVRKVASVFKSRLDEIKSEMEKAGIPGGQFNKLSRKEQIVAMAAMSAFKRTLDEKYLPQIKDALTNAQFERLQQIGWQVEGIQALHSDADLVKLLEVTEEQQARMTAINEEFQSRVRELGRGGLGSTEMQAKRQEFQKVRDDKAIEVLTKEQQEKYANLKGMPFDVTQIKSGRE